MPSYESYRIHQPGYAPQFGPAPTVTSTAEYRRGEWFFSWGGKEPLEKASPCLAKTIEGVLKNSYKYFEYRFTKHILILSPNWETQERVAIANQWLNIRLEDKGWFVVKEGYSTTVIFYDINEKEESVIWDSETDLDIASWKSGKEYQKYQEEFKTKIKGCFT